jgi:hypothetical protein
MFPNHTIAQIQDVLTATNDDITEASILFIGTPHDFSESPQGNGALPYNTAIHLTKSYRSIHAGIFVNQYLDPSRAPPPPGSPEVLDSTARLTHEAISTLGKLRAIATQPFEKLEYREKSVLHWQEKTSPS